MEMPQRKPNRIEGYDYSQNGAYFITVCTRDRKKILSDIVGDDAHIVPSDSSIQHIFDEDAVAHGGVIDKDMGHCAHQFAVLDDGAAGHADVK
jgi:hypothetical protein